MPGPYRFFEDGDRRGDLAGLGEVEGQTLIQPQFLSRGGSASRAFQALGKRLKCRTHRIGDVRQGIKKISDKSDNVFWRSCVGAQLRLPQKCHLLRAPSLLSSSDITLLIAAVCQEWCKFCGMSQAEGLTCLLYTSDAADE